MHLILIKIEENLVPVVLEINPAVLNSFYSIDEKKSLIKTNSLEFYLLPFVPIYFVKNIHFASRDDLEHFNQIKFGNVNNSVIDNKIVSPNFFDGSYKKCKLMDINESPLIPISKTSSIDSLLGSIQILIYVAKNETSTTKTRQYLDFIKRFINREDLYELGERYSLDILETFDKGISDIKEGDSLEVKVFKASLLKLSSEAFQDKTMDADFIEDIVDLIPGSILSKEEEEQIEQFLDLIEDISSGNFL